MEVTRIERGALGTIETTLGYFAVKTRLKTDAMLEVEKTDGTLATIAANTVTAFEQIKTKRKVGFA